jgi:hypothetical protein
MLWNDEIFESNFVFTKTSLFVLSVSPVRNWPSFALGQVTRLSLAHTLDERGENLKKLIP